MLNVKSMDVIENDRDSWEFHERSDDEDGNYNESIRSSSSIFLDHKGMKEFGIEDKNIDQSPTDSQTDRVYRHRKNGLDDHVDGIIDGSDVDSGTILEKNRAFEISPSRKRTRREKSYEIVKVAGDYDHLVKDVSSLDPDDDDGDETTSEFVVTLEDLEDSSLQTSSSWVSSIINSVASIFGAGYVGIPYALSLAGLPLGILLLIVIAIISGKRINFGELLG